jgi:membrane-bound serine protease (ClpP class)
MAFYGLGMLPVNWVGVLLIALAFVLFVADLFVTSHGVLTVGGLVAFLLGSLILINTASAPYLAISLPVIIAVAACVAGFFIFAVGAVWRARRRRVVTGAEGLVGSIAEVRTTLNPSGLVLVQGELWKATSLEGTIQPGEQVVVTAVDGLTLTVKRLTAAEHAGLAASEAEEAQTIKERDSTKMERPAAEKGAY